jgi:hypothetical protein
MARDFKNIKAWQYAAKTLQGLINSVKKDTKKTEYRS